MATNYKVLGQSNPSATTATSLYTVPAATQAIVSTITVCNQAASAARFANKEELFKLNPCNLSKPLAATITLPNCVNLKR